jgi:hypothetical protein
MSRPSGEEPLLAPHPRMMRVRQNTTTLNMARPAKERFRVLGLYSMVAFLQGASFATFSMVPATSLSLFPALKEEHLPWTLNCNNITQVRSSVAGHREGSLQPLLTTHRGLRASRTAAAIAGEPHLSSTHSAPLAPVMAGHLHPVLHPDAS